MLSKPRIVLVEDEAIVRLDVKSMLEEAGYEVVAEASDGETAIQLAYNHQPDLIIMDIKIPKLDGLKAGKIIQRSISTPILLLTAYSQKELVEKAKLTNVLGYLVKPITEANLIPSVEIALAQAKFRKLKDEETKQLQEQIMNRKWIEKAKGILMQEKGFSEEEAYQWLRKKSMQERVTVEQTAIQFLKKAKGSGTINK